MRHWDRGGKRAVAVLAAALAVLVAVHLWLVQSFRVEGACMEPAMKGGERVVVTKFGYWLARPQRGEVVVFRYPRDPSRLYIKRVIGLPEELVEIKAGRVYVDGRPLRERVAPHHPQYYRPLWVPSGRYFVLGDNRDNSDDSRYWGTLPQQALVGRVCLRYWPPARAGLLPASGALQAGERH